MIIRDKTHGIDLDAMLIRLAALAQLLVNKGVITGEELDQSVAYMTGVFDQHAALRGGKEAVGYVSRHDPNNPACPINDPETACNPVLAGLSCNCE